MSDVDLRSDTVTLPTPEMRQAIFAAALGDDVFTEDRTVNKLQELAAQRLGMEDALLVAGGTMGNLVSVLTHCARGEEIILGDISHIFLNEAGGISEEQKGSGLHSTLLMCRLVKINSCLPGFNESGRK